MWDTRNFKDENQGMLRFGGGIGERADSRGIMIWLSYDSHDLGDIRKYLFALETGLINAPV